MGRGSGIIAGMLAGLAVAVLLATAVVYVIWGAVNFMTSGTSWTGEEHARYISTTMAGEPTNPRGSLYMLEAPIVIRNNHPTKAMPRSAVYCTISSRGERRSGRADIMTSNHDLPRVPPGGEARVRVRFSSLIYVGDSYERYPFVSMRCTTLLDDMWNPDERMRDFHN